MGLFGKKTTVAAESAAGTSPQVTAKDLGVVIHVMPKDFLGVEAKLRVESVPPPVAPAPEPKLVVAMAPQAQKVQILPPKRTVPIWMWILILVLILFAGAAIGYVMLGKAQTQAVVEPVVEEVKAPVVKEEPKVVEPVVEEPVEPKLSKDSDSDGLSDIEERMYGTEYRNPDTDSDTFLDGNEVFHRYDPLGVAPSTLLDTGAVKVFSEETLPFTVYYPTTWKATPELSKNTVTFKSSNVASVIVVWSPKDADLTVEDWIVKNVEDVQLKTLQASYTKEGYYTLRSADDLVAYIDLGTSVYVMTYDLATSKEISYTQTFAMMVNSLTVSP
jgi:hypothetical protein